MTTMKKVIEILNIEILKDLYID